MITYNPLHMLFKRQSVMKVFNDLVQNVLVDHLVEWFCGAVLFIGSTFLWFYQIVICNVRGFLFAVLFASQFQSA